jgi:hypothetical protein
MAQIAVIAQLMASVSRSQGCGVHTATKLDVEKLQLGKLMRAKHSGAGLGFRGTPRRKANQWRKNFARSFAHSCGHVSFVPDSSRISHNAYVRMVLTLESILSNYVSLSVILD